MLRGYKKRTLVCISIVMLGIIGLSSCADKEERYETYYFAETQDYIKNPYQGPYFQFYTSEPEELKEQAEEFSDCTMVLVAFNLDDEYEMPVIPKEKMDDLRLTLAEAEKLGLSVIVRAAYDFSGEVRDPEFDILLGHIEQIAAVINENKTCVAGVQAGMIGPFGEWNKSPYMEEKSYRLQVVEKWLQELDEDIPLSLRRQKFIREAQKAGMNTDRLGVYNDGLFSSDSDLGTYAEDYDRKEDLEWSDKELKVPFNGGEMPYVSEYTHLENVIKEAECLNLSYLHRHYHWDVWELWEGEYKDNIRGDLYIKKYLGSRLWMEDLSISEKFYEKEEIKLNIHIRNSGFAMVDPFYEACIIYTYNGKEIRENAELNMLTKNTGNIEVSLQNPYSDEEAEKITIELQICKKGYDNPEYCVQLANEKVDYENGKNMLLTYVAEEKN